MSEATFGLTLRIGAIPLADLRAQGADIRVRKYELSARNNLAMLTGGGASLADSLLKNSPPGSPYLLEFQSEIAAPSLEGLSCRWEPLTPQNGLMLTLMVQATEDNSAGESRLTPISFKRNRFPPEIVKHSLWRAIDGERELFGFLLQPQRGAKK